MSIILYKKTEIVMFMELNQLETWINYAWYRRIPISRL